MTPSVFISYSHKASRAQAESLYTTLDKDNPGIAFLDTADIDYGDRLPEELLDALFNARVIIVFSRPEYFERPVCLLEYKAALAIYAGWKKEQKLGDASTVAPIVIPFLDTPEASSLERFPPDLNSTIWPSADQPAAVAALVYKALEQNPLNLGQYLDKAGIREITATRFKSAIRTPPVGSLEGIPVYSSTGLRDTLHNEFIGREEELWAIHKTLSARQGTGAVTITAVLEAGGGYGKTRLATEYVHRFGHRYYQDGIFWIDASLSVEREQYGVIQLLDPNTPSLDEVRLKNEGVAELLAQLLRERSASGQRQLMVIDNIPEAGAGESLRSITEWCPALGHIAVLATSRQRISSVVVGDSQSIAIPLDILDDESALALLTRDLPNINDITYGQWLELVSWVGALPLALEILNSVLRNRGTSPSELLQRSKRAPTPELDAIMKALQRHILNKDLRGLTEALLISYEKMDTSTQKGARVLAYAAPELIPTSLLITQPDVFTTDVRMSLHNHSFISPGQRNLVAIYGVMHRIVGDFLRHQSEDVDQEKDILCKALFATVPDLTERSTAIDAIAATWLPHARFFFENAIQNCPSASSVFFSDLLDLGIAISRVLYEIGLTVESLSTALQCRQLYEQIRSDDKASLLQKALIERSVGLALNTLRHHDDAVSSLREAISLFSEVDPDGILTRDSMNILGVALMGQNHPKEAAHIFENLLSRPPKPGDAGRRENLRLRHNYAECLQKLRKEDESRKILREVLDIRVRELPPNNPETLATMHSYGTAMLPVNSQEGRFWLQKSLDGRTSALSITHPHTFRTLEFLAEEYRENKEYEAALRILLQALPRMEESSTQNPEMLVDTLILISKSYLEQKDLDNAIKYLQRALEFLQKAPLEDGKVTFVAAWLARSLVSQGKAVEGGKITHQYLTWLINADPLQLNEFQQEVRLTLRKTLKLNN